jgi:hypothetical protein
MQAPDTLMDLLLCTMDPLETRVRMMLMKQRGGAVGKRTSM